MAPFPSSEFNVKLIKPLSRTVTHVVDIVGETNRAATIKMGNTSDTGNILKMG
jgi:hypothetical protein